MATEIDFTDVKTIIRWGVGMTLIGAMLVYLGVGSLALCVAPPVVVMVVFSFLALSASRPWKRHNSQGIALLNQGRMAAALEEFQRSFALQPSAVATRFNIGVAHLALWQLAAARQAFVECMTAKGARPSMMPTAVAANLMLIDALEGHLDAARAHRATLSAGAAEWATRSVLAEAVIDLREARTTLAHTRLRSTEARQQAGTLGVLREALDAWCVCLASGEVRPVDKVGLFSESSGDELMRAWPELAAFLQRAPQA